MGATFVVNQTLAPTSATNVTSVNASMSSVQILAENESRLGATLYNNSTSNLYLLLGTGLASATNFSVIMIPGAYFETPYNYNGIINGAWEIAQGTVLCTELV